MTYSITTNLNRDMFKFVVLGYVTFSFRLVFYGMERVHPNHRYSSEYPHIFLKSLAILLTC